VQIAGSGRSRAPERAPRQTPDPVRNNGPRIHEAAPSLDEALRAEPEIEGDNGPGEHDDTPEPHARDDEQRGQIGEDSLEALQALAGTKKSERKPIADESAASIDDAALDAQVNALGPLPQVRRAHKEQLKQNAKLKSELEAKARELETLSGKLREGSEGKALELAQELDASQKRVQDYEDKLRTIAYTESEDFQKNHVQPLEKALRKALENANTLTVTDENGEQRAASESDLQRILNMDPRSAKQEIQSMFNDPLDVQEVARHYQDIRALDGARKEALKEAGERARTHFQKENAAQQAQQAKIRQSYESEMNALTEQYGDLFGEPADDAEGAKLMARERARVRSLLEDANGDMGERVKATARIHQQAIAYPRVLRQLGQVLEERDALKKQLEAYEASEPTSKGTRRDRADDALNGSNEEHDPFKELDRIAAQRGRR